MVEESLIKGTVVAGVVVAVLLYTKIVASRDTQKDAGGNIV